MLVAALLWLQSSSQVVNKSPMLPPKLKPMRPKMILGSHMSLIHGWCEMNMMRWHEHQSYENWIHLSKFNPHRKHEHCSAKMNSNNWRLVCFLKPTIELLLQVRWNKAIPGSHYWYFTLPNIMSTKYISWKYRTTPYKCTSRRYLIKESWKCLYIQVSRSPCGPYTQA